MVEGGADDGGERLQREQRLVRQAEMQGFARCAEAFGQVREMFGGANEARSASPPLFALRAPTVRPIVRPPRVAPVRAGVRWHDLRAVRPPERRSLKQPSFCCGLAFGMFCKLVVLVNAEQPALDTAHPSPSPPSCPLTNVTTTLPRPHSQSQGAVCCASTDDTLVHLSETFRRALGYDVDDLTRLGRLSDFVEALVHPDDKAWFSSGNSSLPSAHPPVGHHVRKQVKLRSKAGEYVAAFLDAHVHLHAGNGHAGNGGSDGGIGGGGGGSGGGAGHFQFLSIVSVMKSSPNESPPPLSRCFDTGFAERRDRKARPSEGGVLLIETANNPCFGINKEGKVTEWNLKAAEVLGYSRNEVTGRDFVEEFVSLDHRVQVKEMLDDALRGRDTATFECPLVTKHGVRVDVLLNATSCREANGDITGVMGVGQDVTKLKLAEQKTVMRLLMDTASNPMLCIDNEGRINEWNLKAIEIVGYSRDEVMGHDFVDDFISPEWRVQVRGALDEALRGRAPKNFEFMLFTKGRERIDVLLNLSLRRDENGDIIGLAAYLQVITERKKAEGELNRVAQDLRLLIDTANAPIFGIDNEGRVSEWNLKAAEIVGYSSDEAIGRNLVEAFICPDHCVQVKEVLDDALLGQKTLSFEFPLRTKQGRRAEVLINATPRRDADGNITGMVGVGQDVTENKKTMEIEVSLIKARAANDAKSEFLATMSHEMRTPLNGVIGVNDLLLDTPLNDEQREYANLIKTSADSLLNLVNDVLDLARVESGKLELEYFDFDIRNTVEDAIDSIIMKAASKGVEAICALDTNMPVRVRGDADRLKQVILNVLSNAVKFTCHGEVEIRAEVQSETATHHVLRVSVRDTGIGISQDAQSKLFSRFSQVDSSTTRNYGGSGLGLAISKQLVELMSGTMGVISTPGEGSLFWFTVVLERAERLPEEVRLLPSDCSMLVVSQNIATLKNLTCSLRAWGANVSAASDEKEAQVYLNAHRTDTAIMHLTLPENDIAVLEPILSFIAASIRDVRFWILLCPFGFVGKIRDLVADMAKSFAAKRETLAEHAALDMVIISKPVRQEALYRCLTQLYGSHVNRRLSECDVDDAETDGPRDSCKDGSQHEATAVISALLEPDDDKRRDLPDVCTSIDDSISDVGTGASSLKVLVAGDSSANQMLIRRMLLNHGAEVTVVAHGGEAVDLVVTRGVRFDFAIFDINMPIMGGVEALRQIRKARIELPTIALSASVDALQSRRFHDEGFAMVATKPLSKNTCREILAKYGHSPLLGRSEYQPPAGARSSSSPCSTAWPEDMPPATSSTASSARSSTASSTRSGEMLGHVVGDSPGRDSSTSTAPDVAPSVLIVMYNTAERLLLKRLCLAEGCTVHTAETGLKALQILAATEEAYGLCLIDTVLPDIDPRSLCLQIAELVRGGVGRKLNFRVWLL